MINLLKAILIVAGGILVFAGLTTATVYLTATFGWWCILVPCISYFVYLVWVILEEQELPR